MSTTVLLTGAFGHIGQAILRQLLESGHGVVCFDLDTPKSRKIAKEFEGKVKVVWGNIESAESVASALQGVDTAIHLVGIIPPLSEKNAEFTYRINSGGTRTLVDAMGSSETAKRLIFASTIGVFGKIQNRQPPLTNDSPVAPQDHYGGSKVEAEQAITSSGLDWTILRISASPPTEKSPDHGPAAIFEWRPDARLEFIHPKDVSTAFCNAVTEDEAIGKTFAIGGGSECQLTLKEFITGMLNANGIAGELPAEAFKPSDVPEFYGDWVETEESQRILKYQNHTVQEFFEHVRHAMGFKYWLVRMISPLAKKAILKHSPYL